MSSPLNILIVEDSPEDAGLLVHELNCAGFQFHWNRVDTERDFLVQLGKAPDIVLSDYSMPQFSGLRAAELLRQSGSEIPFILVSGTVGEQVAVEAMRSGATDYLLKDRIGRLGPAIRRALLEVEARSERQQLEAQFIEAQKMEVLGQLAGGVAHDFNNLLAVIRGYADLLSSDLDPESPLREYTDEIRHASERAVGLTRQLLLFSRKQKVQPMVLDLNDVVKDMDKMLRRLIGENIEMTVSPGTSIGSVKADPGYLGQVLMNLVVNARDAMPNGGKLNIVTANVTLDEAYAQSHTGARPGPYVMLGVSDSGTGMTDEVKAHLFEAFFTTKPKDKGTGLGLSTCQTIVQQFGGHIGVYSEVGKGTAFKVYFPRIDDSTAETATHAEAGPLPRGTETLLVVEDEPSVRQLAQRVLEAQGYKVLSAANGQEALQIESAHQGAPIRLVVSDVIMPVMGGKVMAEWLRTTSPDLRMLFTSGYTDDAIVHHGILDPGVAFLPKPYTPETLTRRVRETLDAPAVSTAA